MLSTHVLPSLLPQTSNQYLCYYKNQDSQDLLACIDLRSVGDIAKARRIIGIMMTIPFFAIANCLTIEALVTLASRSQVEAADAPCEFYLQLGGRRYYIKAKTPENAELWVTGLKQRRDGDAAASRSEAKSSPVTSPKQVQLQEVAASASASGTPTASGEVDKSMRSGGLCDSCVVL